MLTILRTVLSIIEGLAIRTIILYAALDRNPLLDRCRLRCAGEQKFLKRSALKFVQLVLPVSRRAVL